MISSARVAIKMLLIMVVLTGILYPLSVTLIAKFAFPKQANGSLVTKEGVFVGSELIAQRFQSDSYFWPRPSAIEFDPLHPSGGSNLGPTSQKLKEIVQHRKERYRGNPPSELLYASGSGLDPHISLETAYFQLSRVQKARRIANPEQLKEVVDSLAEGFGEKYVNVLLLNQELDRTFPL